MTGIFPDFGEPRKVRGQHQVDFLHSDLQLTTINYSESTADPL